MLKKILLWTLLAPLFLVLIVFSIFFVSNFGDQELRPEVSQALHWQAPARWKESNAFVMLNGLDAKSGDDGYALGAQRINHELERYQQKSELAIGSEGSPVIAEDDTHLMRLDSDRCQYNREENCVQFYLSRDRASENRILAQNYELIERFNTMKSSTHYTEVIPPVSEAYLPPYSYVVHAFEVQRMESIRKIADGDCKRGLRDYLDNANFAHRLYAQARTMVSANVYLALIERDIRVLNELSENNPECLHYAADIDLYLSSLKRLDLSMAAALAQERDLNMQMVKSLFDQKASENFLQEKLARVVIRKKASLNYVYDWMSMNVELAKQPAQFYFGSYQEMEGKRNAMLGFGYSDIYLRDPLVKILMNVARDNYFRYIERVHDLEGIINLQRLFLAIRIKHLSSAEIPAFIEKTRSQYPNPYTNKAMQWDAISAAVIFEAKQESSARYKGSKKIQLFLH